tara:strand:+ start:204 stop:449 length:246 start_codon:yes stop_codon:yes gene_type:complete
MSSKHYQAIANCFASMNGEFLVSKKILINKLIRVFEADNPRFSEDAFRDACVSRRKVDEDVLLKHFKAEVSRSKEREILSR